MRKITRRSFLAAAAVCGAAAALTACGCSSASSTAASSAVSYTHLTGCFPHPQPGHLLQQPKLEAYPAGVPGLVDGVAGAGAALHGGSSFSSFFSSLFSMDTFR